MLILFYWYQPYTHPAFLLIFSLPAPLFLTMGEQPQADSAATLDAFIAAALPHPQPANIAAALAAINVRSHIPFILELNSRNNSRWHGPFHSCGQIQCHASC